MELSFNQKSGIYLLGLVAVFGVIVFSTLQSISSIILPTQALAFVLHVWMSYAIYNDAVNRGMNENWFLLQFFLGPIGLGLYYLRVYMN